MFILANVKLKTTINLGEVFSSSPIIYSLLLCLSMISIVIFLYSLLTLKKRELMPEEVVERLKSLIGNRKWNEALVYSQHKQSLFTAIVTAALKNKKRGFHALMEAMKDEGKRQTAPFWQRLSLLSDIVLIAPMLGLLGTVLGIFYAFYDVNRSIESIISVFDGLGIAIGTTVSGILVAVTALFIHVILKYRITKILNQVEEEALNISNLIDEQ